MKILRTQTTVTEIEVEVTDVGLHFDGEGITAMVRLANAADRNEVEEILISWEQVLHWAMSSSQEDGDCKSICNRLRSLLNKLEAWDG